MRNRFFSCYLQVAFLFQNQESFFRKKFASPINDSSCLLLVGAFAFLKKIFNMLRSGAVSSFEMDYPKQATLMTGFELVFFSLILKFFLCSLLLTASILLSNCSMVVPYTNTSS